MTKSLSFEDLVTACYRSILRREPEDPRSVLARAQELNSAEAIIDSFLQSEEYRSNLTAQISNHYLQTNHLHASQDIEVTVSEAVLVQMFERIKGEWAALGETEPFWSVLTSDMFRSESIQAHMDLFLESGRTNVIWMQNIAQRNGITLGKHQTCFELGCGVGRLTLPLAEIFDHVTGADISPGNLAECQALVKATQASNITTKLLTAIEQIDDVPAFDVLFTIIVLQHNPPPVQIFILDRLLSKIRPGGVAYFQLPTHMPGYSFSADIYLKQPTEKMETHAVPMHAVLDLLHSHGFALREVLQDQFTGKPGSHSFMAVKDRPGVPSRS